MISGQDLYNILAALVPLYVVMILAYGAVRWWKVFTPDQCTGIHRLVAMFSVPLLLFEFIAKNNPYAMNHKFIVADSLQKLVILLLLFVWLIVSKTGSIDWVITLFSIATLPNTFIIGVPLLDAMYGKYSGNLMVQIVFLQCLVWSNVVLVLFEYRGAKILIYKKFPKRASSISSFSVDPEVKSLNGDEALDADAEVNYEGKLCVNIKRLFHSSANSCTKSEFNSVLSGISSPMEIYGERSFREMIPRDLGKEIHMFEWSSYGNKVSKAGENMTNGVKVGTKSPSNSIGLDEIESASSDRAGERGESEDAVSAVDIEEGRDMGKNRNHQMPSFTVMTKLILIMVWRRMIRIPNTYATVIGFIWSLVAFRFGFSMPKMMSRSISILSTTALGLSMFSLGLCLASQTKIIACGKRVAACAMVVRFLVGPAVAAVMAAAIGLRGDLLRISIVQAALPLAMVPFVYAQEYNLHADIISTSVSFGLLIALPVTILYYVVMA